MTATTAAETTAVLTTITLAAAAALTPGDAIGGGFYAGQIRQADGVYAMVVAPKDGGEHDEAEWHKSYDRIEGALSYFDGRANTTAMAEAGSELGQWALGLRINGLADWYLPARDELEVIYRALKPTAGNYASFRDGENASSVPVGYPYTKDVPGQTAAEAFQEGGAEAFEQEWYWTSTQSERGSGSAWFQGFSNGYQYNDPKDDECRARAVRRLLIQ